MARRWKFNVICARSYNTLCMVSIFSIKHKEWFKEFVYLVSDIDSILRITLRKLIACPSGDFRAYTKT